MTEPFVNTRIINLQQKIYILCKNANKVWFKKGIVIHIYSK